MGSRLGRRRWRRRRRGMLVGSSSVGHIQNLPGF
jgi:hypothetical protein